MAHAAWRTRPGRITGMSLCDIGVRYRCAISVCGRQAGYKPGYALT